MKRIKFFVVFVEDSTKGNSVVIDEIVGDFNYEEEPDIEINATHIVEPLDFYRLRKEGPRKFNGIAKDIKIYSIQRRRAAIPIKSGEDLVEVECGKYIETKKQYEKRLKDAIYSILTKGGNKK